MIPELANGFYEAASPDKLGVALPEHISQPSLRQLATRMQIALLGGEGSTAQPIDTQHPAPSDIRQAVSNAYCRCVDIGRHHP